MSVPLTYLYAFDKNMPVSRRQQIFQDFAECGAKHLVLTDELIKQIHQDQELPQTLQKEISAAGLTFVDAHAPFGPLWDLNCPEESLRDIMIARHKLNIRVAAMMGVDTITIHIGNDLDMKTPFELHRRRVEEALEAILPDAEKYGVTVCIENIWFCVNTPEELLRYKSLFPTDALGFCYDAGHANLMDKGRNYPECNAITAARNVGRETPSWDDKILEKMLPHVVNCHIHDNMGQVDEHVLPGKGNIDWVKISSLLKQAPRLKNIQSEAGCFGDAVSIKETVEALKKYFA